MKKQSLWAKIWSEKYAIVGFICMYVCPLLLFGVLGSFTKSGFWAKFTVWFYLALALFFIIITTKLKDKVKSMPHSIKRGVYLSIFTFVFWGLLFGAFVFMGQFADKLLKYWYLCGVSFLMGRVFYIMDEIKKSEN